MDGLDDIDSVRLFRSGITESHLREPEEISISFRKLRKERRSRTKGQVGHEGNSTI